MKYKIPNNFNSKDSYNKAAILEFAKFKNISIEEAPNWFNTKCLDTFDVSIEEDIFILICEKESKDTVIVDIKRSYSIDDEEDDYKELLETVIIWKNFEI